MRRPVCGGHSSTFSPQRLSVLRAICPARCHCPTDTKHNIFILIFFSVVFCYLFQPFSIQCNVIQPNTRSIKTKHIGGPSCYIKMLHVTPLFFKMISKQFEVRGTVRHTHLHTHPGKYIDCKNHMSPLDLPQSGTNKYNLIWPF